MQILKDNQDPILSGHSKSPKTFKKNQRLLTSADFSRVFDDAPFRAAHENFLILSRTSAATNPRLGLVIAKKNIRKAHDRNRIKRLIRESFRQKQHKFVAIDAIVLARKGADKLTNHEILKVLEGLWKRVTQKARKQTKT